MHPCFKTSGLEIEVIHFFFVLFCFSPVLIEPISPLPYLHLQLFFKETSVLAITFVPVCIFLIKTRLVTFGAFEIDA